MRALLIAAALGLAASTSAQSPTTISQLPGGSRWMAQVPANWNGTLLLWSRGYSPSAGNLQLAPPAVRDALLAQGYALAASDYGHGGWALADAVPSQDQTIDAFAARYGRPKRIIAWGYSMGGLVTTALAEQQPSKIDGAMPFCASIGGAVGMMNMALDGAFAFKTLLAPTSDIRIVNIDDDGANAKRVGAVLAEAVKTSGGRARVALAGVLAGLPGWTTPSDPEPATDDYESQAAQIAKGFVMGVFLPRVDQEQRSGGVFSWNKGVDYRRQLALSGRRAMLEALYRRAGLSLDKDLAMLDAAPRIAAKPAAVDYMLAHYTPNARPRVPLLTVQATGDGATSPSLQRAYIETARSQFVQLLWVEQAGHCAFRLETVLASLHHLERRLDTGRWPTPAAGFIRYTPPPMLRPCVRGRPCR